MNQSVGCAAVSTGPTGPMELRHYPVREPGPGEILVRVSLAMICGSDLHMWRGEVPWFQKTPGIEGHEMTGCVEVCCSTTQQSTCCELSDKAACCGTAGAAASAGCGCR